jgi:hypothetical protein
MINLYFCVITGLASKLLEETGGMCRDKKGNFVVVVLVVLEIKLKDLCMLGKRFTAKLHPWPAKCTYVV